MKNLLTLLLLLLPPIFFAQNISGKAIYEWKASSEDFRKQVILPNMAPELKAFLEEKMKKMFQKTYILHFGKNTSLYKQEDELDIKNGNFVPNLTNNGIELAYFRNIQTQEYVLQKEFASKNFIIKDSLQSFNWKLESETKVIGDYSCNKATAVIPVSLDDRLNYERKKTAQEDDATQFFEIAAPTEKVVTVWYTT